eukprot:1034314-Amphidinium_carterae.3
MLSLARSAQIRRKTSQSRMFLKFLRNTVLHPFHKHCHIANVFQDVGKVQVIKLVIVYPTNFVSKPVAFKATTTFKT